MLIKTILKNVFTAFSHPRIFSHGIFKGKLYTKDRLQYTVLPYNTEIPEPAGLDIFLKGLAQLEIDKSLIVNGRVLTMLAHKLPLYDVDTQSDKSEDESEEMDTAWNSCSKYLNIFHLGTCPYAHGHFFIRIVKAMSLYDL
jgi:hypothetical protein